MKYNDSRDKLTADIIAAIERHGGKIELDEDGNPIISLKVTDSRGQSFDGFMYLDEIMTDELVDQQQRIRFPDDEES